MKNTHHAKMYELVIGKDMSWMETPFAIFKPTQNKIVNEVVVLGIND